MFLTQSSAGVTDHGYWRCSQLISAMKDVLKTVPIVNSSWFRLSITNACIVCSMESTYFCWTLKLLCEILLHFRAGRVRSSAYTVVLASSMKWKKLHLHYKYNATIILTRLFRERHIRLQFILPIWTRPWTAKTEIYWTLSCLLLLLC